MMLPTGREDASIIVLLKAFEILGNGVVDLYLFRTPTGADNFVYDVHHSEGLPAPWLK